VAQYFTHEIGNYLSGCGLSSVMLVSNMGSRPRRAQIWSRRLWKTSGIDVLNTVVTLLNYRAEGCNTVTFVFIYLFIPQSLLITLQFSVLLF